MRSSTSTGEIRVYRYCWIVLGAWMAVDTLHPRLWICHAPVASRATSLWG